MTSKTMNSPKPKSATASRVDVKKLATMAMLVALAYVVTVVTRFPLMAAASYLKYDPKDVVLLIGAYLFGPLAGAAMSIATCFIEMITVSDTGIIGFVMQVIATLSFSGVAAVIYRRIHTHKGGLLALVAGTICMAIIMVLWNLLLSPIYLGTDRATVVAMLVPAIIPFNVLKGIINSVIVLLIYKPVVNGLRRTGFVI